MARMVFVSMRGQNEGPVVSDGKLTGVIVEYLDGATLRAALVVRDSSDRLGVRDASGREHLVARQLVLLRHPGGPVSADALRPALEKIEEERERLRTELDLDLLWDVVHEQERAFSAEELAELFFGQRSAAGTSVMLEALLRDRVHFVRRNLEFAPRDREQVERLRVQESRVKMRSEEGRRTRELIEGIVAGGPAPEGEEPARMAASLLRYLENPYTRNQNLTAILERAVPDVDPAEAAFEILERMGNAPAAPRYALIGGLRTEFGADVLAEAASATAPAARRAGAEVAAFTIDDEETVEIDDALGCERLAGGAIRVWIHIALVADFVRRAGAIDIEASARATTVYLPETTIRMLPDEISCGRASLIASEARPVLTTEVTIAPDGSIVASAIYPSTIRVAGRLTYAEVDRMLAGGADGSAGAGAAIAALNETALRLRERRRQSGAILFQRREPKVRVRGDEIDIEVIDANSPARTMVAELMILSNNAAARFAADNRVPLIYRVQPASDNALVKARLSLYPEFHAGLGLECYAQVSSPIRRYADLVLQRQIVAAAVGDAPAYSSDEMLAVLANCENADVDAKNLERRARRFWTLRYLERQALDRTLEATAMRDGQTAELDDYVVRGAMHGAPSLQNQTRVMVRIARIDPLRGSLYLDYAGPLEAGAPSPA